MRQGQPLPASCLQTPLLESSIGVFVPINPIRSLLRSSAMAVSIMITIRTPRFGLVVRPTDDVLTFPGGIFGFELQMRWLLLGDREHGGLYWLQNVEQPDLSLSVVDPREFVSDYRLHIDRAQLRNIWNGTEQLIVLAVLTEFQGQLCLNLRNPFVINPSSHLGRQVVTTDGRSFQHPLSSQAASPKKAA